jgi:hypothetical protein
MSGCEVSIVLQGAQHVEAGRRAARCGVVVVAEGVVREDRGDLGQT